MAIFFLDTQIFTLQLQNGFAWLVMLLFLFLFITLIIGAQLMAIGKMIHEKDETGVVDNSKLNGENIKLIPITFRCDKDEFKQLLYNMPDKSVQLLQQWFRFDFLFMCFLYPFMFFLVQWLRHYSMVERTSHWMPFIHYFGWLVLAIWIFDVLENTFALAAINRTTTTNVILMRITSVLKWVGGLLIYAIPVLIMLGYELYLRISN